MDPLIKTYDNTANPAKKTNLPRASESQIQTTALCPPQSKCAADPEKPMRHRALKTLPGRVVVFAFLTAGIGTGTGVQAQTTHPADSASMAKPPVVPGAPNASGARTYNPDNMPTKRPALPPNSNRMLHNNPASDAIAK